MWQLCIVLALSWRIHAIDVEHLSASNFELSLQRGFAAVLFHDKSSASTELFDAWESAAGMIESLHDDALMGAVDGTDPGLKEFIDAYAIVLPSIRVFRRSVIGEYRGPSRGDSAKEIAEYIQADALPSVKILGGSQELRQVLLEEGPMLKVVGIFSSADLEEETGDAYSVSSWGQYQAAADSLRGHSTFYATSAEEVISTFSLDPQKDLPAVYLLGDDKNKVIPYRGDILEQSLAEWVLRHSSPPTGELTLASPGGELFATQFFSSRKLKFILFLNSGDGTASAVQAWLRVADAFSSAALFSYMVDGAVPNVASYFDVDVGSLGSSAAPVLVAHDPSHDYRYKAPALPALSQGWGEAEAEAWEQALRSFVQGVVNGGVNKMLKSEAPAAAVRNKARLPKSSVVYAVGSTVEQIVSAPGKDVLLMVTSPKCSNCRKLAPTLDILAKAVQGEPRILVAKIDGVNNDLPSSWGVRTYPTLLWFTAQDKESGGAADSREQSSLRPRPYWDAGFSLGELVTFVQRKGSFDLHSLRVASAEQLGSLLGDEEVLRAQYDELFRFEARNDGRHVYENAALDYVHGEIVFDGKRWHLALAALLALYTLVTLVFSLNSSRSSSGGGKKKPSAQAPQEATEQGQGGAAKKTN